MQNAKSVNMPKDRVEAAIKRAQGKEMENFEEILYEGYGPHGVAILVETATRVRFDASASGPTLSGASRRYPGPDKTSHAAHILPEAGLKVWSDRTARRRLQVWQPIMNPAERPRMRLKLRLALRPN